MAGASKCVWLKVNFLSDVLLVFPRWPAELEGEVAGERPQRRDANGANAQASLRSAPSGCAWRYEWCYVVSTGVHALYGTLEAFLRDVLLSNAEEGPRYSRRYNHRLSCIRRLPSA